MQAVRTILVLWDIDHTLIESRGAGTIVYEYAFPRVTGREFQRLATVSGRTELDIIHDTLELHGLEASDELVGQLAEALADGYRKTNALAERGRVLPGAREALETLASQPKVQQSVLSGNTTEVSRLKVETFGLDRYLDLTIGAYGDDRRNRAELVTLACRRASEKLHAQVKVEDAVVIGDTPSDVAAALEAGARVIGVASGKFSIEDLTTAGASVVLPDLIGRDIVALVTQGSIAA